MGGPLKRSLAIVGTAVVATVGLGVLAPAAQADCVTYSETQDYTVKVPTPYGPVEVSSPAVTDVNPSDCVTTVKDAVGI